MAKTKSYSNRRKQFTLYALLFVKLVFTQNSMVGDGFGGRLWYKPTNYAVGSYCAFSICNNGTCNDSLNQLYGWGHNALNQLGLGQILTGVNTPTTIPNMNNVKYLDCGYNTGIIKNDNTGWICGYVFSSSPMQVISNAKHLSASSSAVSFVKYDGTIWSVGSNTNASFGNGTQISTSSPTQMLNINNAVRVASTQFVTTILLSDGTLKSVGTNTFGLLGIGSNNYSSIMSQPVSIPTLNNIIDIQSNSRTTLALDNNGDIYAWGLGTSIGDGDFSDEISPKKITSVSNIVAISGTDDGSHFLALDENKNCFAWGNNSYGQLGIGNNNTFVSLPTLVATNVIDIMAGELFSYIIKSDGTLWCSGTSFTSVINNPAYGSIWLNLSDVPRNNFTQLNLSCDVVYKTTIKTTSACNTNNGIAFIDNMIGQSPYSYNIGNGSQTSNIFTGLAAGNYTVTITDANLCTKTITCNVPNGTGVTPTISVNSSSLCSGQSLTLTASGANDYFWQQSTSLNSILGSTVIATPTITTIYTVTGTNNSGCASYGTSTVTIPSNTISVSNNSICIGNSIILNALGANSYTWSPSSSLNNSNTISVIASPSVTTTYTLYSNIGSCTYSTSQQIVVETNLPNAYYSGITSQTTIAGSVLHLLNLSSNYTNFKWELCGNTVSNDSIIILQLNDIGSCCIKLLASNNSCIDSVTKCINVVEDISIKIPNVFTPNGDGVNDIFKINSKGILTLKCEIYNRWGQKVYEWNDINGSWDGKTKTGNAPSGTYFYIVNYSDNENISKSESGFLTLFRE